jgi:hypothetical protein
MPENVHKIYQSRVFFENYAVFSLDIPKQHKLQAKKTEHPPAPLTELTKARLLHQQLSQTSAAHYGTSVATGRLRPNLLVARNAVLRGIRAPGAAS